MDASEWTDADEAAELRDINRVLAAENSELKTTDVPEEIAGDYLIAEIKVLRALLVEAAPFINDALARDAREFMRFRAMRERVNAALNARPTMLSEDAPQLYKKGPDNGR